jgi:hypothetical protein
MARLAVPEARNQAEWAAHGEFRALGSGGLPPGRRIVIPGAHRSPPERRDVVAAAFGPAAAA